MKNNLKTGLIAVVAIALGMGISNFAMSSVPSKIAVVDVGAVVAQSAQVQSLKKEQETKMKELQTWLNTVKTDINKQSTQEGKEKLVKKYDAEFAKKQEAIRTNYAKKLQAIDKSISNTIATEAKSNGYDIVLAKGVVLYGGTDITANIKKAVK